MEVIYHSDDAGASAGVTEDILSAWELNALDGFSVLANGSAAEAVAQRLRASPQRPARIAVHLNLTDGPPTADARQVPLLTDQAGLMRLTFGKTLALWLKSSPRSRQDLLAQVEVEWRTQISRVQSLCAPRPVRALDGHNHVHMLPFLFPVAARLAKEMQVPEIRLSREPFFLCKRRDLLRPFFHINVTKHLVLRYCSWRNAAAIMSNGLAFPAAMIGILYTGRMSADAARAGIRAAQQRNLPSLEVVFHVGRIRASEALNDGAYKHKFFSAKEREHELSELLELRIPRHE